MTAVPRLRSSARSLPRGAAGRNRSRDRLRRRLQRGVAASIAVALCGVGLGTSVAVADTDGDASATGPYRSGPVADHKGWMGRIPDSVTLSQLSIPATHDSASVFAGGTEIVREYAQAQGMWLGPQLDSGIRALDIRAMLRVNDNSDPSDDYLTLAHGVSDIEDPVTGEPINADVVFKTVCGFLKAHPTETVLMKFGDLGLEDRNEGGVDDDGGAALNTAYKAVVRSLLQEFSGCVWRPAIVGGSYETRVPTLGEVRGRIVMNISGYGQGGLWGDSDLDEFGLWTALDGIGKTVGGEAISFTGASVTNFTETLVGALQDANAETNTNALHWTWLNANSGAVPYHFADGLDAWVPEGINERMVEWLLGLRTIANDNGVDDNGLSMTSLGVVASDFPGASLIETVIAHNFRLFKSLDDVQFVAGPAMAWWAAQVNNEIDDTAQDRFTTMRAILAHFLPGTNLKGFVVHDSSKAVESLVEQSGLDASSGWVDGYQYRFWSFDGRAGLLDEASVTEARTEVSRLVAGFNPKAALAGRVSALQAGLEVKFPKRRVSVLGKQKPGGPSNWWFSGSTARDEDAEDDGYMYAVWIYDAPEPPVAVVGDRVTVDEGELVTLDGSGSYDPAGYALTYCWELDGVAPCEGTSPTYTFRGEDDASGSATLTVSNGATTGTASALFTVRNVAPSITRLSATSVDEDGVVSLSGDLADPGIRDSHEVIIDWGDGSAMTLGHLDAGVALPTYTHRYLDDDPSGTPADAYTVAVTVSDKDGGTWKGSTSARVDNVAPSVTELSLTPELNENAIATLSGTLVDPGTLDSHDVVIDWGDRSPKTTDHLAAGEPLPTYTHRYLDDDPTGTSSDTYTLEVTVTDDDTGSWSSEPTVVVKNVPPAVTHLSVTGSVDEGGLASLTGDLIDQGSHDSHEVSINWGDGSPVTTQQLDAGEPLPTYTHRYLDDNPTGTPADLYTVQVTVTDDDLGTWSDTAVLRVNNVYPGIVDLVITSQVAENGLATLRGTLTDPGTQDPHQVRIDWGDGSPVITQQLAAGAPLPTHTHRYLDDDPTATPYDVYTVTVTVTDDDAGQWTGTEVVRVDNVDPSIPDLSVTATVAENGLATLRGTLTDPGPLDSHDVTVTWGDGSTTTRHLAAGAALDALEHRYLDDDPTATPSDGYTVTVTVTDDDAGRWTATRPIRVDNVAPVVSIWTVRDGAGNSVGSVPPNDVSVALLGLDVTASATFGDVGTLDTHRSVIAWGDGSSDDAQGTSPVSGTHRYLTVGDKTITVTVTDDDSGSGDTSRVVRVVDAAGAILVLSAELKAVIADPATPAATRDLAQKALDALIGQRGGTARDGALDSLGSTPQNSLFVKLATAADLLQRAGMTSRASLVALTAKSVIIQSIDAVGSQPPTDRTRQALAAARAAVAEGDRAASPAAAIEFYRTALIDLRPVV